MQYTAADFNLPPLASVERFAEAWAVMTAQASPAPHDLTALATALERCRAILAGWDMSQIAEADRKELSAIRQDWADDRDELRAIADRFGQQLRDADHERRLDRTLCRAEESRDEHDHNTPEREQ